MAQSLKNLSTKEQYNVAYRAARVVFSDITTLDADGKIAFIQGMVHIGINADVAANAVTSVQIR